MKKGQKISLSLRRRTPRLHSKNRRRARAEEILALTELFEAKVANAELPPMKKELRFDPKRSWRLDYYYSHIPLAVEIHGLHSFYGKPKCKHCGHTCKQNCCRQCKYCRMPEPGRHLRPDGFQRDREKMNEAQIAGWVVLEFTEASIKSGDAIDQLVRAYRRLGREAQRVPCLK